MCASARSLSVCIIYLDKSEYSLLNEWNIDAKYNNEQ